MTRHNTDYVIRQGFFKFLVYKDNRTQNYDPGRTSNIHHPACHMIFYKL